MTYRELRDALNVIPDEQLDSAATAHMFQGDGDVMFAIRRIASVTPAMIQRSKGALKLTGPGYLILSGNVPS